MSWIIHFYHSLFQELVFIFKTLSFIFFSVNLQIINIQQKFLNIMNPYLLQIKTKTSVYNIYFFKTVISMFILFSVFNLQHSQSQHLAYFNAIQT